jgi:hypothetical protein
MGGWVNSFCGTLAIQGSHLAGEPHTERQAGGREVMNMKRTTGVMVAMWLVVLLLVGPALAALPLIVGTNAGEQIRGTRNAEEIRGLGGLDEITDGLGGDLVYGGAGGIT